ncbi:MAG: hypothetical protein ACI9H6_000617, partial [Patiriisocius sp.]
MQEIFKTITFSALIVAFLVPTAADARYRGDVAGWLPWWSAEEGIRDVERNMDDIDILYPFVYEVDSDGDLVAKADLESDDWGDMFDEARDERVEIIPTVMWFDGDEIHAVLSDKKKRNAHIDEIVDMVDDGRF